MAKKKPKPKRLTEAQTNLSYGIFEAAANACGMSMLNWFPPSQRGPAAEFGAQMHPERYARAEKPKTAKKRKKRK